MKAPRTQGTSLRRVVCVETRLIAPDLVFLLLTCREDTLNPPARLVKRPFYLTKRQAREIGLALATAGREQRGAGVSMEEIGKALEGTKILEGGE